MNIFACNDAFLGKCPLLTEINPKLHRLRSLRNLCCLLITIFTLISLFTLHIWTLTPYHACLKNWINPFLYLKICLKNSRLSGKQCRPWSDSAECGVRSWCTLFAVPCESETFSKYSYCQDKLYLQGIYEQTNYICRAYINKQTISAGHVWTHKLYLQGIYEQTNYICRAYMNRQTISAGNIYEQTISAGHICTEKLYLQGIYAQTIPAGYICIDKLYLQGIYL